MNVRNCFPMVSVLFLSMAFSANPKHIERFKCEVRHAFSEMLPDGKNITEQGHYTEASFFSNGGSDWQQIEKGISEFSDLRFTATTGAYYKYFDFYLMDKDGKPLPGHPMELSLDKNNHLPTTVSFRLKLEKEQEHAALLAFLKSADPNNGIRGYLGSQSDYSRTLSGMNLAQGNPKAMEDLAKKFVYENSKIICEAVDGAAN